MTVASFLQCCYCNRRSVQREEGLVTDLVRGLVALSATLTAYLRCCYRFRRSWGVADLCGGERPCRDSHHGDVSGGTGWEVAAFLCNGRILV